MCQQSFTLQIACLFAECSSAGLTVCYHLIRPSLHSLRVSYPSIVIDISFLMQMNADQITNYCIYIQKRDALDVTPEFMARTRRLTMT